jgi:SAM-dependent methyltransferase
MDLLERRRGAITTRHPWEVARVQAMSDLVERLDSEKLRTLDVGCGDAFLISELQARFGFEESVAQDIHLTEQRVAQLLSYSPELARRGIEFVRELADLEGRRFDLILLLDVLEHVEEPRSLLQRVVREHLATAGHVLITVPAFQSLFTEHDRRLKHFRRYSRREILELAGSAGLTEAGSGYLFSTLLVPRALRALQERIRAPRSTAAGTDLDSWNAPPLVTRALCAGLCLDNRVCLSAQRAGLTLPGLTAWVLCNAR